MVASYSVLVLRTLAPYCSVLVLRTRAPYSCFGLVMGDEEGDQERRTIRLSRILRGRGP